MKKHRNTGVISSKRLIQDCVLCFPSAQWLGAVPFSQRQVPLFALPTVCSWAWAKDNSHTLRNITRNADFDNVLSFLQASVVKSQLLFVYILFYVLIKKKTGILATMTKTWMNMNLLLCLSLSLVVNWTQIIKRRSKKVPLQLGSMTLGIYFVLIRWIRGKASNKSDTVVLH